MGVAAANKLINEKVVAVIGAYCSSATIPASEPLIAAKIFMITPASTSEKVTERGMPFMFRTCGRDDDQSKAAIKFMVEQLKAKTVYIVDDKTTYSQGLADNVEKMATDGGLKVLGHEHVNQGDKDYSAILTKVKAAKPDVFYVSLQNSASAAPMLIQVARMGIKTKILAQDAVYHPQLMELAKKDADARLQEHWPAFLEGARARGVDETAIRAVWDMMRSFSGYSFVKAHSASYAMLSFQSAYLRAHYPAQFMAAVLSNHGGFYSTLAYTSESRRMGLRDSLV